MSSEKKESDIALDIQVWLEKNKSRLGIGLIAAMVIGVIVTAVDKQALKKEKEAFTALAVVGSQFDAEGQRIDPKSADYLKVLSDYPDSKAAPNALILLAGKLYEEGDFQGASVRFQEYLANHPGGEHVAIARLGKAACMDAKGETEQAKLEYKKVATDFPNNAAKDQSLLALASLHELENQPEEAKKVYEEMSGNAAASPTMFSFAASSKLRALLERHPELRDEEPVTNAISNLQQAAPGAFNPMINPAERPTVVPLPTPTETPKSPAPAPDAKAPAPTPDAKAQAPTPDAKAPAPTPDAKAPAPTPDAKVPAPKPDAKTPPPAPDAKTPEPDAKAPAPDEKK